MNTTIEAIEVRSYLDAVEAALSDVPESERCELLEDLEQHLLEVAAEDDGTLEDRLGSPEAYAQELRASAGLGAPERGLPGQLTKLYERVARSRLVRSSERTLERVAELRGVRAVATFLPELRPGWWVLRGYLVVAAPAVISSAYAGGNLPAPYLFGSRALGLLAVGGAIWASVAAGRRHSTPRSRRYMVWINAAVVVIGITAAARLWPLPSQASADEYVSDGFPTYLHHADGSPITNICPYAADGTLLRGVLLYDQDGRGIIDTFPNTPDGFPLRPAHPIIRNAYPLDLEQPDPMTGERHAISCPPVLTPAAQPEASSAPGAPTPIPSSGAIAPGAQPSASTGG